MTNGPSIVDYAKSQNFDHIISNDLLSQLSYFLTIKDELFDNVEDITKKIDSIIEELKMMGIALE